MNPFSLRFKDKKMECKYFEDQFKELMIYYRWTCIAGSLSACLVLLFEFFNPFGLDQIRYLSLIAPVFFYATYITICRYNSLFNLCLAIITFNCGVMLDFMLEYYMPQEYLFVAGQSVALIQFSLLLGTNFILNISLLTFNMLSFMVVEIYKAQTFKSLHTIFILAYCLAILSFWTSEKKKRDFFLLKHTDRQIQNSLDNAFQINILRCVFDEKLNKTQLIQANPNCKCLQIDGQDTFVEFIRNLIIIKNCKSDTSVKSGSINKNIKTLEQFIHFMLTDKNKNKNLSKQFQDNVQVHNSVYEIYTKNTLTQRYFKVKAFTTISLSLEVGILMIQEDIVCNMVNTTTIKQEHIKALLKLANNQLPKTIKAVKTITSERLISDRNQQVSLMPLLKLLVISKNIILLQSPIKYLKLEQIKLSDVMYSIKDLFKDYLKQRGMKLLFYFPRSLVLTTDKYLLTHLIMNFTMNLMQSSQNNTVIKIIATVQSFVPDADKFPYFHWNTSESDITCLKVLKLQFRTDSNEFQFNDFEISNRLDIRASLQILQVLGTNPKIFQHNTKQLQYTQEFTILVNHSQKERFMKQQYYEEKPEVEKKYEILKTNNSLYFEHLLDFHH